jgi:cytochrome c oxidase subunit 2
MPIGVEVTSQAQFAQWVASKGGHMPGAKPAGTPAAAAGGTTTDAVTPAPATSGTAVANPAPAPQDPNVSNRTNQ